MEPVSSPGRSDALTPVEDRVLTEAVRLSVTSPWTDALLERAGETAGLAAGEAGLLFPNGALDLAASLAARHDRRTLQALATVDPSRLKVRDRIRIAVETRIEVALADEAAVRRASLVLARPANARLALVLAWTTADVLWRWAGDTATDENHYSKRVILAAVLASTLATALARGRAAARAHLRNRIENVMAFERWKAGLPRPVDTLSAVAATLGRLRYGRRREPMDETASTG